MSPSRQTELNIEPSAPFVELLISPGTVSLCHGYSVHVMKKHQKMFQLTVPYFKGLELRAYACFGLVFFFSCHRLILRRIRLTR